MLFLNKEGVLTPNTVDQTCNSSDHALSVALRVPTAVRRVRVTDECAMCINLQVDLATVASSLLHCTADVVEGVVRGCRHDCCSNVSAGILGTSSEHTARITSACKVAENSRQDGEHTSHDNDHDGRRWQPGRRWSSWWRRRRRRRWLGICARKQPNA